MNFIKQKLKNLIFMNARYYRRNGNLVNPLINRTSVLEANKSQNSNVVKNILNYLDKPITLKKVISNELATECSKTIQDSIDINDDVVINRNSIVQVKPLDKFNTSLISQIISNTELNYELSKIFPNNWRIVWVTAFRNIIAPQTEDTSWKYHIDNIPPVYVKGMLLFNDTNFQNGAMEIYSHQDSAEIISEGHKGTDHEDRQNENSIIEKRQPIYCEGSAGDLILFSNNNIHKARIPKEGYRDTLHILFGPSADSSIEDLEKRGKDDLQADPGGYPKNPLFVKRNS